MSFRVSLLHPISLAGSTIELKTYEPTFCQYDLQRQTCGSPFSAGCITVPVSFTEADPSDTLKDYALSLDTGDTG